MRNEIENITTTIQSVLAGEPWYGRSVMALLQDVKTDKVYDRPAENAHSLIELLYHMNTWAEFTLRRLSKIEEKDISALEKLDWRAIEPKEHTWEKGLAQFKVTHDLIIELLETQNDDLLSEEVAYREYNFRFLLNGLIQHDIYHIGQIAYVSKFLSSAN
ncbi:MAG TPA: DinB family protein [Chitinophagaceae bacterium]